MKKRRATQKDIARELGISPSLVSRALGGTAEDIGADPATVRRIQERASSLGYVPSATARQLRGLGQPIIGLTVADLQDPFFGPAVAEIIAQSHRAGFALTLAGFEHRQPRLEDVQLLLQHDLKALLVLGSGPMDWVEPFFIRGVRIICIGGGPARRGVIRVAVDEAWGIRLVAEHLVNLGHRNVAFIGARVDAHEQRLLHLREHLRGRQLKLDPKRALLASPDVLEAGERGADQLIEKGGSDFPSAIVCSSDAVALGVLRALARHGYRVPEHVSVTGYDDLTLARLSTPPLTSVRQPLPEMVEAALRLVEATTLPRQVPLFRPTLMVRGSTTAAWNS